MKWAALAVVLVCACGNKKAKPDDLGGDYGCAEELSKKIVPALVKTLDGGDADGFHRATDKFQQTTMCGPDFSGVARDWEQSLRETDAAKGSSQRKALVVKLRDDVTKSTNDYDFAAEKKALVPLFEQVK
jgi:hypothetical protein